jgi:WD40 repeat protein
VAVNLPDDGRALLVVEAGDRSLVAIDLESGRVAHTYKAGEAYQPEWRPTRMMVVEMPVGPMLLASAHTGVITVYSVESGAEVGRLEGHQGLLVKAVSVELEGAQSPLATCSGGDNSIRLWEMNGGVTICELVGHEGPVNDMEAFRGADALPRLLSGSKDGSFIIWLLSTGEVVLRVQSRLLRHVYHPVETRQGLFHSHLMAVRTVIRTRREVLKVWLVVVEGRSRVVMAVGALPGYSETTGGLEIWELEDPVFTPPETGLRAANKLG